MHFSTISARVADAVLVADEQLAGADLDVARLELDDEDRPRVVKCEVNECPDPGTVLDDLGEAADGLVPLAVIETWHPRYRGKPPRRTVAQVLAQLDDYLLDRVTGVRFLEWVTEEIVELEALTEPNDSLEGWGVGLTLIYGSTPPVASERHPAVVGVLPARRTPPGSLEVVIHVPNDLDGAPPRLVTGQAGQDEDVTTTAQLALAEVGLFAEQWVALAVELFQSPAVSGGRLDLILASAISTTNQHEPEWVALSYAVELVLEGKLQDVSLMLALLLVEKLEQTEELGVV